MLIAFEIVLLDIMLALIVYMVEEKGSQKTREPGIVCIMAIVPFIVSVV